MKGTIQKIECTDKYGRTKTVYASIQKAETFQEATTADDFPIEIYADVDGEETIYEKFDGAQKRIDLETAHKMVCTKYATNAYDKVRNYVADQMTKERVEKFKRLAVLPKDKLTAALKAAGIDEDDAGDLTAIIQSLK